MSNTYITKAGDCWDYIAFQQLGSCQYVNKLMDANRQLIDTSIFSAGVELILPDIEKKVHVALPPWRRNNVNS